MKKLFIALSLCLFGANVYADITDKVAYQMIREKDKQIAIRYEMSNAPKILAWCAVENNPNSFETRRYSGGADMNELLAHSRKDCPDDRLKIIAYQK